MRISLFVILISGVMYVASAQKKTKGKEDFAPLDVTTLSETDALKAETLVIDAERELILENEFKALELFKAALEIDATNAVINFKIAEILLKNGEGNEALPYAKAAMQLDRNNKYYILLTAETYKALAHFDEAAELYQWLVDHLPETDSYLFDLAILYQYQEEYDKALATYQRIEEVYGLNEMVLREKQKIYLKNKDFEGLMADWDKLIAEHPDNPRYTIELCEFLISQNKLAEARERLQQITDSQHASLLLSQIFLKEGKTKEAMDMARGTLESKEVGYEAKLQMLSNFQNAVITTEEFDEMIEFTEAIAAQYPAKYEVQAFAGDVLFNLLDTAGALRSYKRAIKLDQSNYGVWQNILTLYADKEQFDSVVVYAEKAMDYFPNQAPLYYFAGTGYLILKDYKKSIRVFEQGKKYATDPKLLTIFYGQMGDAYNSMKDYDKSYAAYEKALEADPDNDHVLNNYSYFLSLRNIKMDMAQTMSARLVKMHPDNATYLDTHGWVLYVMGRYDEAVLYLHKAAELQEDGTVIEHYGDVLFKLGKVDEAVSQWKRASKFGDVSKNLDKKIADKKLYE